MKIVLDHPSYKKIPCVATIGVFDGLHLGHKLIIKKLKQVASKEKASSLVVTFDIPPRLFFSQNKKDQMHKFKPVNRFEGCLSDLEDKEKLIAQLGINYFWVLHTKSNVLQLSGEEFLIYLKKYIDLKALVVGEDFRFGYRGHFDIKDLQKLSNKHGFSLFVLKKKKFKSEVVSSSLIRRFIVEGQFEHAKTLLGYPYVLKGKVYKGHGVGKELGFPTANIRCQYPYVVPQRGVYAAEIRIGKKKYLCAVNIGLRPTIIRSNAVEIEAHILNFKGDVLGRKVSLTFLEKIRNERKFPSREKLKHAISRDVDTIQHNF